MNMSTEPTSPTPLRDRFPQIARLGGARRTRRIPVIQQLTATDCGAACLAMVLRHHGKLVPIDQIRQLAGIGRDGVSARSLLVAARSLGLSGRGVRIDVPALAHLSRGAILHWSFNHFVVFERLHKDSVEVVDPALGRRRVPLDEVRRAFTGVALVLEPSAEFAPSQGRVQPVWRRLGRILAQSGAWGRIAVTSLVLQLFALGLPLLTGAVVDRVVPNSDDQLLFVVGAAVGLLIAFHFVAWMIRGHLLVHLRTHFETRLTLGFFDHLLELPYDFFQRRAAGDLLMRINSNALIREILSSGMLSGLLDATTVCGYLVLLFVVSPAIAGLTVVLAGAQVVVFLLASRRQRELMTESVHAQSAAESFLVELLSGMETLKAMSAERRAGDRWVSLFVDQLNVEIRRARLGTLIDALLSTIRIGSPLMILGFGALQVLHGQMTLGVMLSVAALTHGFLAPLSNVVATASQLQLLDTHVARIDDVLQAAREQPERRPLAQPLQGRVSVEQVSFAYSAMMPPVLREVSVEIDPGQFVAVVGRSGSGKSTLASVLVGLYAPSSGRISYDGRDLAGLDVRSVREQLGIVTQRAALFAASIRDNVALGAPDATLDDVVAACQTACIHDDIQRMPMGYDTILVEAGASLSGGQRQRIALARALLRKPSILLLDEATSALDAAVERDVQHRLEKLRCTRIVIAHRLSTVRNADVILVVDEGTIVERGTHAELIRRGGLYATLVGAPAPSLALAE